MKPEQWQATCLREYIEQLSAAVQMLAHQTGYHDGATESRWTV